MYASPVKNINKYYILVLIYILRDILIQFGRYSDKIWESNQPDLCLSKVSCVAIVVNK